MTFDQIDLAVTLHDRMGAAELVRFFRIQRGVDPTKNDGCAGRASGPAHFVAAKRVAGMNTDSHEIAGMNGRNLERFERFVGQDRVAAALWGGGGKNI